MPPPESSDLFRFFATVTRHVAALLSLTALALAAHVGNKPAWAGGAKPQASDEPVHAQVPGRKGAVHLGAYFGPEHRQVVQQDHARMIRAGYCPPGLAKKGNGCMPPGQAKKAYSIGQPLPPGVVYYELPPVLAVRLGAPPAGHRFVRVAADILLIAIGTGMVVDAMEDLGF